MSTFKKIKEGLLEHIIAALIFLIFIEPLLKGMYRLVLDYITHAFVNYIYKHAAVHSTTQSLIFVISLLLLGGLFFCIFYVGLRSIYLLKVTHTIRHLKLIRWIFLRSVNNFIFYPFLLLVHAIYCH